MDPDAIATVEMTFDNVDEFVTLWRWLDKDGNVLLEYGEAGPDDWDVRTLEVGEDQRIVAIRGDTSKTLRPADGSYVQGYWRNPVFMIHGCQ